MLAGAIGAIMSAMPLPGAPIFGACLVGLGLASTPAIVTAAVRERSTEASYASALSLATACLGVGQLISPALAGAISDIWSTDAVPVLAGAAYAAGVVTAALDGGQTPRN